MGYYGDVEPCDARCEATESGARCVKAAGHSSPHYWEDVMYTRRSVDPGRIATRRADTFTFAFTDAIGRWLRSEVGLRRQDMLLLAALLVAIHYLG